jgi:methyl coenzyme M reductase gamma subunit
MEKLRSWPIYEFLHVKRDWNQSADRLASEALQQEKGRIVMVKEDQQDLRTLNRLDELLTPGNKEEVIKVAAITRSAMRRRREPELLQEEVVQRIRIERIKQAQEEEVWIRNLKLYLTGDPAQLSAAEAKTTA